MGMDMVLERGFADQDKGYRRSIRLSLVCEPLDVQRTDAGGC